MLKESGWLSVRQHIAYHSIMLMWKVRTYRNPKRLVSLFERSTRRRARIEKTKRC